MKNFEGSVNRGISRNVIATLEVTISRAASRVATAHNGLAVRARENYETRYLTLIATASMSCCFSQNANVFIAMKYKALKDG